MKQDDELQLVTFRVGGHTLGLNVLEVERVLRYATPSPLPKAPDFLEGMLPYGEDAIPVIDLRKRLSVPAEVGEATRIIVVHVAGRVGLVVDAVLELATVNAAQIQPPPPLVQGLAAKYVHGLLTRPSGTITLVAMSKLLTSTERLALETATAPEAAS